MDLRKKSKSYSLETAPKHRKLELRIDLELKRGVRLDGSYESYGDLIKIKFEKTLICTTDSKLKDMKEEIIYAIQSQFEDLEKQIDNSEFFSDGFWSDEKEN